MRTRPIGSDLFEPNAPSRAPSDVTLVEQIKEVEREIRMRERKYPDFINKGWLTKAQADKQMHVLRAVLQTLEDLHRAGIVS